MHVSRERLHVLDRRRRQNAVAQIEDVPRASAGLLEDLVGGGDDAIERAQEHGGIQVALDAAIEPDALPGFVERRAPVCADDVAPRLTQLAENRSGADAEMD